MHYIERLRTEHMQKGRCALCGGWYDRLEGHHECYRPERKIYVSHKMHHRIHFYPWLLTVAQKKKLLEVRHAHSRTITDDMIKDYCPPGRRAAQLDIKRRLKQMNQEV